MNGLIVLMAITFAGMVVGFVIVISKLEEIFKELKDE